MRRVVFLDFDGVIGAGRVWSQNASKRWTCPAGWLDPLLIARLNRLWRRTGAVFVLSTSWRKYLGAESVAGVLHACGFLGEVIGATPVLGAEALDWRVAEIGSWLVSHPAVRWCVIDDLDLAVDPARFVRTDMQAGLTDADCDRVAAILEGA